jgi:hypothetical protein
MEEGRIGMPITPAGLPSTWVTGDTVYGICCCRIMTQGLYKPAEHRRVKLWILECICGNEGALAHLRYQLHIGVVIDEHVAV